MSTEAQRAPVPPRPDTPPPVPTGPPSHSDRTTPPDGRPVPPPPADPPPTETTARLRVVPPARPAAPPPPATRRRPVGAVDLTPRPGATPAPPGAYYAYTQAPAETPVETTTRLRPVKTRHPARTAAAAACVVLGLGLIGGAVTGSWLTGNSAAEPGADDAYTVGRSAWHSVPVDTLFPRTLKGEGAGPGATDRAWTRVAVASDSDCAAGLDPLLLKALRPVGCARMARATYTDATHSSVTTVGMVFTEADAAKMSALSTRFTEQRLGARADLMPRTYPAEGTVAAGFGDGQRASWTVHVLTEVPVVVFAVSGFADGRGVAEPQPAAAAMASGATTTPAQAGLGHEAEGIADRVERTLRRTVTDLTEKPE
ncbi:hypothetical protein [Streptomyces sp. NBC_01102]|uniref:hypothetical protein n=1 Tax=Streptomyces sp. NBC_01102 TaxID=2903749 RepID=UPI00386372AC